MTAVEFYRTNLMALVSTGKTDFKTEPEIFEQAKEMENQQQEEIGLMEIELKHTKTLLASCEKALEDRNKQDKNKYKCDWCGKK